jgi:4-hydroxyacetophenone monooxygenase
MATVKEAMRPELCAASDATIDDAVGYADPMVLRGLLFQLTGDAALKTMPTRTVTMGRTETTAPAGEAEIAMLRRKAADFLKAHRDAGAPPIGPGPKARLAESLGLIVGQPIKDEALDLMIEETALDPWARALEWQDEPDPARLAHFSVAIIGAGMGGLNAAVQL